MLELKAEARKITGKKVNSLRSAGSVPAVLYGRGIESVNVCVDAKEFNKALKEAGETTLLSLNLGSKKHNVLIHDLARDPLSGEIMHVDFFEVRMDEKMKASVPLVFVGESAAVKAEGGVLVKPLQEVELEALPQDLPKDIQVDISPLRTFEDKIYVKDLKVSGSIKILSNPEDMVASVVPPRSEEELAELEQKPVAEVGEIERVGEEEKVSEAPAEEEAKPAAAPKEEKQS